MPLIGLFGCPFLCVPLFPKTASRKEMPDICQRVGHWKICRKLSDILVVDIYEDFAGDFSVFWRDTIQWPNVLGFWTFFATYRKAYKPRKRGQIISFSLSNPPFPNMLE